MTMTNPILFIVYGVALVLWAFDSRFILRIINRFKFSRSMPQPAVKEEENPFITDRTKEAIDTKFREMITTAYRNTPGRWDVWGPEKKSYEKTSHFYKTEHTLEPLLDSLLEELEKTEPEIYKIVLRKHFFRAKRRREKEE